MIPKRRVLFFVVFSILMMSVGLSAQTAHSQATVTVWLSVDPAYHDAVLNYVTSVDSSVTVVTVAPENLESELLNAKINGSLPDAVLSDTGIIPSLVTQNVITAIGDQKDETLYPGIQRTTAYYELNDVGIILQDNIKFYGYPIISKTVVLFENTKLWSGSITTMSEFYDAALRANDQTIPSDPKYGFAFIDLPEAALALFYGDGATMFKDGYVDATHLQVTGDKQVTAFQHMYTMTKERKLTPSWDDQGTTNSRDLFANQGRLALLIDTSLGVKAYKEGSVFGETLSGLKAMPVPGNGAPLRSIALMPTITGDMDAVKTLATKLLDTNAQKTLFSQYSLLPTKQNVLSTSNDIEKAFDSTLKNGKQLPINIQWSKVESVFSTEIGKLIRGEQNHTRTATSLDINLRIILPDSLGYKPIPVFTPPVTEEKGGFLSSPMTFWVVFITLSSFVLPKAIKLRRRK